MARPEYLESPMSSRSRRSSRVLPPAPELDSLGLEDEDRDSSPHRSSRDRDRDRARGRGRGRDGDTRTMDRLVLRDREWERRQDEEILMQTPDSRASSSSRRLSRHYHSDPRGRQPTPPHSVSSSRASTRVPHPPMSSMTRPSTAEVLYRRPSLREPIRAGYDDQDPGHGLRRARSHARSIHAAPSVPVLRDSMYASGSESNGEDTETTYDSLDDRRRPRRGDRSRRLSRHERSPSRAEPTRSHHRPRRRRRDSARLEEDYDEMNSRHTPSIDDELLPPLHPRSRPQSRAPSARHIPEPDVTESEDSQDDHHLRDRFERRGKHRNRHDSHHKTESRRRRSESHMEPSSTPKRYVLPSIFGGNPGSSHRARSSSKRYYDTEVTTIEKPDRHHPPSASLGRSNTVSGSQAAASQHHSVSSTRRSSSSTFLGNFFGPSLHSHHHHATDKRVKM